VSAYPLAMSSPAALGSSPSRRMAAAATTSRRRGRHATAPARSGFLSVVTLTADEGDVEDARDGALLVVGATRKAAAEDIAVVMAAAAMCAVCMCVR
jgi:hypothetical protein